MSSGNKIRYICLVTLLAFVSCGQIPDTLVGPQETKEEISEYHAQLIGDWVYEFQEGFEKLSLVDASYFERFVNTGDPNDIIYYGFWNVDATELQFRVRGYANISRTVIQQYEPHNTFIWDMTYELKDEITLIIYGDDKSYVYQRR